MENHHFMLKVSRIFPSSFTSCQFRSLPDVAETKLNIPENDHSKSLSLNNAPKLPKIFKKTLLFPHSQPTNRPPAPAKVKEKTTALPLNHSSTSNGGWFTSSDDLETDTFFSLSSNSGDSFRLRTAASSRRFRLRDEMKSIDETGRCSFSSAASFDTVLSKCSRPRTAAAAETNAGWSKSRRRTPVAAHEIGSDHISTQLYYHDGGSRRRPKNRRRIKKSGSVIGDSYAVEKRSNDPRGDFRRSMVEMIVEKQIFGAEDLERLLGCFLSLNSTSYHGIIFDVFSEICQTLFTN